ncbi:RelA/SpoT family protein [Bacteroides mediterraneensis]|uniref:Bifunctional (P)ppGpp synthetase/guanosine-3',5'-bis(Diphosphate) 3'-pyrophosphohydrolase n=1 Tax=Bacteroides mediterraneensis TaxID=1841856 RepID=A0ABS2EVH7_9BACE|nr:RelA/SpoT family protein [Bacteroides mediterraneensis]MBM6758553.1 bifunctional (p)ppGpp synthetase/guanosine-3',5'-bis(diphosphate) 3'-pyrophosphohydrolase [Bacteroides mediterraneensis]MBM6780956.1 bifunctional (p)ppGpp synthetase/guanosine-3',5'-bis(diphosphate) 3'-pyrophosphohydrolase [Bacteroides mediterraneensis]
MENNEFFTPEEHKQLIQLYKRLLLLSKDTLQKDDCRKLKNHLIKAMSEGTIPRNVFQMNPIIKDMQTAVIVAEEIGMRRASILGIMLHESVKYNLCSLESVKEEYGEDVAGIIRGLVKINELYSKSPIIESENFRNLLLSFAEDMRVILIIIADRVNLMRQIKDSPNEEARLEVANEAAYLYAPLAHKLGLYKLKSELEDLSLKYTQHDVYYYIKEKLNATKQARDRYIDAFIEPIKKKLEEAGLKFHMKGRTKSIHSIYQKMKKQGCPFEGVYDLFAIRIILDSPLDKEKQECWQAYSIVTDMYLPNPKRLRDWLSVPKSNGYESLHITVMGPEGKWVEVQIRTERMDEIAEKGLAAHWRYKGIKGESGLDEWLNSIRETLENSDNDLDAMDQFKLDLYKDEVFVFTPKGDLYKLPQGATVLDFAFSIHSNLGCRCTGARVNGKNVQLRQKLNSGDQVEIMTSNTQTPKRDWLTFVTTAKARNKIRQALKEIAARQTQFAKETLERKFKNRKMEYDEAILMRLIRKLGFKTVTDFYQSIADESIDVNDIIDKYLDMQKKETEQREEISYRSAESFNIQQPTDAKDYKDDVLVIDQNLKGLDFTLAKCCNPIYGDEVFGFVSINGGIKIHRCDCPNAKEMRSRFPYRIVKARWAGKSQGKQYPITLRIIGHDDIGIVTNITSIINKENNILLRSISIDSHDGLFSGMLTVTVDDNTKLESLIKKIKTVKGVKQVNR